MYNFEVLPLTDGIRIEKEKIDSAVDMPAMHVHGFHEMYILLKGERRYFIGHSMYDVSPGDIMVIPENELHRTIARNSRGYERYVVYFYETYLEDIIKNVGRDAFDEFLNSGCFQLLPEYSEKIRKDLEIMEYELNNKDRFSEAVIKNLFQGIVLTVMRHGRKKRFEGGEIAEKINEVARYISENYASEIGLHDAAKMAYMEDTYFSKRFKSMTGFRFSEYLVHTRIKAAEKLLLSTEMNIGKIAESCGFSGGNYFGDVFKRRKGVSPREYREKMFAERKKRSDNI